MKRNRFFKGTAFIPVAFLLVLCTAAVQAQNNGIRRAIIVLPDIDVSVSDRPLDRSENQSLLYLYGSRSGATTKRNRVAYMHFNLANVPFGAIVDSVYLKLYLKDQNDANGEQSVAVYELENQDINRWSSINWANQPVTDANIHGRTILSSAKASSRHLNKSIDFPIEGIHHNWLKSRNENLWFFIAANSQQYAYYSSRSGDLSRQPKLLIIYHMPYQLQYSNWSQYKNDAQHTAQLDWESNTTAAEYKVHSVFVNDGANYVSSNPILCNGLLVFHFQASNHQQYTTKVYTENGYFLTEYKDNGVGQQLIADRLNNIYYLKGSSGDSLKMLRLIDGKISLAHCRVLQEGAQGNATPVVGFDGSIYVSTNKGVYAYTPFPEFKLKWKYSISSGDKLGTVTLSEDERSVYMYESTGKFIALDNIQGTSTWEEPMRAVNVNNHMPVASVRNGRVCVTNGYRDGSTFYLLDAATGRTLVKEQGGDNTISQPFIGTDDVFTIINHKLRSYRLSDGAPGSPASTDYNLNPASTIVLDKSRNLFLLNTEERNQYLTTIRANGTMVKTPIIDVGNLIGNSLLLAPDGRLFTRNDNGIYAISPSKYVENGDITIPFGPGKTFSSEYSYKSNAKITVQPADSIKTTQNVIIQSGLGGVVFPQNFKVKHGAQLSVKTGYYTITLR